MPIKPENLARYPADWPQIVARIRQRSGNRCEWCGVLTHAVGYRDVDRAFVPLSRALYEAGHKVGDSVACSDGTVLKIIKIVLTVAHIHDPDPANCDDDNLAHLCQRCHNIHDAPMRQQHARESRRAGKAIGDLFEAA